MISDLKFYLDTLFVALPDTDEVIQAKSKLYDLLKQQYKLCIQQGLDQQTAYQRAVESIGDISDQIAQLRKDLDKAAAATEQPRQQLNVESSGLISKFVRNVSDLSSGLVAGILNRTNDLVELDLVNTIAQPLDGISSIKISYIAESITLYHSTNGRFVVREFMNQESPDFFAEVEKTKTGIKVKNGKRRGISLRSRVEIDVPADWKGILSLTTVHGDIESQEEWSFNNFSAKTIVGEINLKDIRANNIRLSSSIGSLVVAHCMGNMELNTVGGNIRVNGATGGGIFSVISGDMELSFEEINQPLKLSSENGEIYLHLPQGCGFELEAVSVTGAIYTSFDTIENQSRIGMKYARGFIGQAPFQSVEISSTTGCIHISG